MVPLKKTIEEICVFKFKKKARSLDLNEHQIFLVNLLTQILRARLEAYLEPLPPDWIPQVCRLKIVTTEVLKYQEKKNREGVRTPTVLPDWCHIFPIMFIPTKKHATSWIAEFDERRVVQLEGYLHEPRAGVGGSDFICAVVLLRHTNLVRTYLPESASFQFEDGRPTEYKFELELRVDGGIDYITPVLLSPQERAVV